MGSMGASSQPISGVAKFYLLMEQQFFILLAVISIILTIYVLWRMVGVSNSSDKTQRQGGVWLQEAQSHRVLRLGLGFLWLVDGLLQAQPAMSNQFISGVIQPISSSQPAFLAAWMEWGSRIWSQHPYAYDLFAMWIQVAIGLLLLFGGMRMWSKVGLVLSLGWGLIVWIFGEGFGGLLSGSATWLSGAPGSVVFYLIAAGLLLLPNEWWESARLRRPMQRLMGIFWILLALLQAWPSQLFWTAKGLSGPVQAMASMPQPHILSEILFAFANALAAHPVIWNGLFVLIMTTLGFLFLIRSESHYTWWLAFGWLFGTWFLGQDFGVLGGLGTDPNSAPPFALLLVATIILQKKGPQDTDLKGSSHVFQQGFFAH
ncbi:hypothetical protein [Sulfoacidibacillus thermotolerans]|uniref:Uncharacterized protein n=1 Tax=Sulfoacidibacillus thermotolerans TaxID=1765684 RepID=A0A2U3D9F1_SULT2|nr:hypothetical protein [Sulfoacidibacillus thermotolerans]PWI57895.1 hypothetical protein BM613_05595 [Sulfoacidibacillus thermotolerans]